MYLIQAIDLCRFYMTLSFRCVRCRMFSWWFKNIYRSLLIGGSYKTVINGTGLGSPDKSVWMHFLNSGELLLCHFGVHNGSVILTPMLQAINILNHPLMNILLHTQCQNLCLKKDDNYIIFPGPFGTIRSASVVSCRPTVC